MDLRSHCRIKVVLLPVGDPPAGVFQRYVKRLQRLSTVPIKAVTRLSATHFATPFTSQHSWDRGELHFSFVDGTAEAGVMQSAWEGIHASVWPQGVLGLMHSPSCNDIVAAHAVRKA